MKRLFTLSLSVGCILLAIALPTAAQVPILIWKLWKAFRLKPTWTIRMSGIRSKSGWK